MRIIFVPQFPSEMRYQEWWWNQLPQEFIKRGFDQVIILGGDFVEMAKHRRSGFGMFSPIDLAIHMECEQVKEFMDLELKDDDVLFLSDLSFPGIFSNVLYHKKCSKMYAFCHATSANNLDYFSKVSYSKFPVECGHADLFDGIFLGSMYHREKLLTESCNNYWHNSLVTYLPFMPVDFEIPEIEKTIKIMSASRPSTQKVDTTLENQIEHKFDLEIQRPQSSSWFNYYWNLKSSKILLITAFEDTFGYQIVDAIVNGCIPLARNDYAYPELLPREYLYDSPEELEYLIERILEYDDLPVPELLCKEQMNKFYDVICDEMQGKGIEYPF